MFNNYNNIIFSNIKVSLFSYQFHIFITIQNLVTRSLAI